MTFQQTVLVVALILLIISLIIIALLIKSATLSGKFPPETGKCPDYTTANLSEDGTLNCIIPDGLGSCPGTTITPDPGTDVGSITNNCNYAKNCGLVWDGITNIQNNETGQPYC